MAMPMTCGRVDAGGVDGGGHGGAQHLDVVVGHLQRPVRRQAAARAAAVAVSMTPWGYSWTAVPSSAPSETRTTRARPDSVPKSTPMT